ncbi:glycerophosphodiester phosphodiesterase family protein [Limnobacter sp. MED105]|uniref:glycerophosphodiester phosphodiesterase n=1 Tax=Limnobacter sp. MED105 TaxID=391597 RepID=UPI000156CCC2|nr:glycerophosphodiester phosphodiesterase family protein [Limnobacter sp. MED105]EDM82583.1 cytoplasmic glycerophosphodiester phosphodiesterase [Limnobacter sp. MED105]
MELWAHRGSGKDSLENTIKGFEIALNSGFNAVEFDVMLTSDSVPMIHHDWVMGRCARSLDPAMAATDPLTRFDSLRVRDLRHYAVQGEPIPSLAQTIAYCLKHNMRANVELKATSPSNAIALGQAVKATVEELSLDQKQHIRKHWVFSSFYHASLLPLQGYDLALLYEQLPDNWVLHADALQASAIHLHWSGAEPVALRRIHTTGRVVRVYTVNDAEQAKTLQALGIKGLFTDRMTL